MLSACVRDYRTCSAPAPHLTGVQASSLRDLHATRASIDGLGNGATDSRSGLVSGDLHADAAGEADVHRNPTGVVVRRVVQQELSNPEVQLLRGAAVDE